MQMNSIKRLVFISEIPMYGTIRETSTKTPKVKNKQTNKKPRREVN